LCFTFLKFWLWWCFSWCFQSLRQVKHKENHPHNQNIRPVKHHRKTPS
jgi:hypothetical protein